MTMVNDNVDETAVITTMVVVTSERDPRFKNQDLRSLHYLVREITLWHFDIHHNNINKTPQITLLFFC